MREDDGIDPFMKSRRNYPLLLASQFLSAFGDTAILAVIVGQLTVLNKNGSITETVLRQRSALYTSLLFIPYILLAPLGGYLNDRYAKTVWLAGGNAVKLLGTVVCAISIWQGYAWQMPGYLIVGIGACFYGPAKYGILPEILPAERLVKANGMVELLTLTAILGGNIVGSVMVDRLSLTTCYVALVAIYTTSFLLNLLMTRSPSNPGVRLGASITEFAIHTRDLLSAARLGKVLIGTALFWVAGAAMKINFQPWGLNVLHLTTNTQISLLGLWLAVGIMGGSILAGVLHRVGDLRWTRRYGFGLVAMLVLVWSVAEIGFWRNWVVVAGPFKLLPWVILLLIATGVVAGLFLIPLNASLQSESDPAKLGKTIAVQNLTDNLGMLLASGLVGLCLKLSISASGVFGVLACVVLGVVLWLRLPARPAAKTV